ncbi:class D sortase [Clostridium estertheticum]|uniref:class D sortase n=1 Tax=Clostridium estertheticum TaxID=238834 RepID=UPI0013E956A4|nr:class D sortase [Clostridium estertheticum]MBZ9687002.1 class D sortase [Clostridium estertheticum]
MNKVKLSWGKISLAFLVLGLGCISWSLFSIWTQSHYTGYDATSSDLIPATFFVDQSKLKGDNTTPVESDPILSHKSLYPLYPTEGDNIGSLTIPALKRKLPIFQGTGSKELTKGVGHFLQSVLPGENDNCVLAGHRDTVFRQLGNLKIGDKLIVQTSAGVFTYEVSGTRIVHEDDKTVIVPTDHAVLTVTTCYPFDAIGNAPDRYIVSAALIKSK